MVQALKFHKEMKYLDISANEIGSQGFMYFLELFKENHFLKNLHVRKNQLNIKSGKVQEFVKSLRDNTHLYYLDLNDNLLDDSFGKGLIELLDDNYFIEDLSIFNNPYIG
jgi:Ran GTPase-activating protein (RanGAP) involved in mRNA processing and transport